MTPLRLLFASWHNYLDPSNGASISTREVLLGLSRRGWQVATLCGPGTDFPEPPDFGKMLASHGVKLNKTVFNSGTAPFSLLSFRDRGIASTIHLPKRHQTIPDLEMGNAFLQTVYDTIKAFQPGILVTYGGAWIGKLVLELAKKQGVKTVVTLHNLAYSQSEFFRNVDLVIVPSAYAANHYRTTLGLETVVIPPLIDPDTVRCDPDSIGRRYVVFVNPEPAKGVSVFLRIVKVLSGTRPDIPFLVVEARHKVGHLKRIQEDLRGLKNLHFMTNTSNPKSFYSVAKIVLQPSLCHETFGRVAAEAMMNGIPVLASDRGSLPEICGQAGLVFHVPEKYTPETRQLMTEEEAMPWVDTIIKLYDDPDDYQTVSRSVLAHACRWKTECLLERYEQMLLPTPDTFQNLHRQTVRSGVE